MAISGFGFACRPHLPLVSSPLFHCIRQVQFIPLATPDALDDPRNHDSELSKRPEWKKFNSVELGISISKISVPTRKVLNGLKQRGYDVYLVGGCVRDLILKRTPKDFDIITSAELKEVVRSFSRCDIIGRRFPICHVHIEDTIIEVSSFSTNRRRYNRDLSYDIGGLTDCDEKDLIRWTDCVQRDFTINGLMFDPYAGVVYDYIGGLEDLRKSKVQTVIPASTSFKEDCARILRAVRIAARLGFRFSKETAHFVKSLSLTIRRLDKYQNVLAEDHDGNELYASIWLRRSFFEEIMEIWASRDTSSHPGLNLIFMFSGRLFDVLVLLYLPLQAAYFIRNGFRRSDKRSNLLLSLFSNLDKLLAPDRPCHSSLWLAILAFHKALSDEPRNPVVVAAFCLAVHNGGDVSEGVKIAQMIMKPYDVSFHELSEPHALDSATLIHEVVDLAGYVKRALYRMTDEHHVSMELAGYPQAPYSDLVFIPLALYLRVCRIFQCVREEGAETGFTPKRGGRIDYELLGLGSLQEIRHAFARVVFDTIYPPNLT